jgi:hypothetical protein
MLMSIKPIAWVVVGTYGSFASGYGFNSPLSIYEVCGCVWAWSMNMWTTLILVQSSYLEEMLNLRFCNPNLLQIITWIIPSASLTKHHHPTFSITWMVEGYDSIRMKEYLTPSFTWTHLKHCDWQCVVSCHIMFIPCACWQWFRSFHPSLSRFQMLKSPKICPSMQLHKCAVQSPFDLQLILFP